MAVLEYLDIANLIFKQISITDIINFGLTSDDNNKIVIQNIKYKKYRNFYKSIDTSNFSCNIYVKYFLSACEQGLKFIIKYLVRKYDLYYDYDVGLRYIIKTNNLKYIEWYYSNFIDVNRWVGLTRINFKKLNFKTIKYLITKDTSLENQLLLGYNSINIGLLKYILTIKNIDLLYLLENYTKYNYNYKEKIHFTKYLLSNYNFDNSKLQEFKNKLNIYISRQIETKQLPEWPNPILLIYLFDQKLNNKINYGISDEIILNLDLIRYNITADPEENIKNIQKLLDILIIENYPKYKFLVNLWDNSMKTKNLSLIKLIVNYFEPIIKSMEKPFEKKMDENILDFLVHKFNIKFNDLILICLYSNMHINYLTNFYKKNNPLVTFVDFNSICDTGSVELLDLVLKNNKNFIETIKNHAEEYVSYNRYNFKYDNLRYFLENNIITWKNMINMINPEQIKLNYFESDPNLIPDFIEYIITNKNNIDFKFNFINYFYFACKYSWKIAQILNKYDPHYNPERNIKIWLGVN